MSERRANGFIEMSGQKYGRLSVIAYAGSLKKKARWECLCDCGSAYVAIGHDLRSGNTSSCGCIHREQLVARNRTHGRSGTTEYNIWAGMIDRCTRPAHKDFHRYGGRGITICDRWRNSFEAFFSDMGCRPSQKHSIDRMDNDGNYEPGNCQWTTQTMQVRNSRRARPLTLNGRTQSIREWSVELDIGYWTIVNRLARGYSHEEALTRPFGRWIGKASATGSADL
jgi:hypothetical protein